VCNRVEVAAARHDRVDDATINAPPARVCSALRREVGGGMCWWLPELGFRPLRSVSEFAAGTDVEVIPGYGS
jgi:hypothetical protein